MPAAEVQLPPRDPPAATASAETPKGSTAQEIVKSLEEQYAENIKQIRSIFGPPLAQSIQGLGAAREEEARVQKDVVAPAAQAYAQPRPTPPVPGFIPQPPVRDISARPFMDNPQAKDTLGNVVSLLGTMAQMAMAGRAPVAALNAFSGAMNGWAEGDRIRAQREWTQYLGQVDKINADNMAAQRAWEDAMRVHGSNELAARAQYIVALDEAGQKERATLSARQGMQDNLGLLQYFTGEADKLRDHTMKANQYILDHELKQSMQEGTLALRKEMQEARLENERMRRLEAQERIAERAWRDREFLQLGRDRLQTQLETPDTHQWWDKQGGHVATPTKLELINDSRAAEYRYKRLLPQQVQLIDRLAVAKPVFDRLDQLIDKINAAAPGENISQGLVQRLKNRAGIGADIREFQTLMVDSNLENTAALSGGMPRIAILYMLRDEASPNEFVTREVAHRQINTGRTTIKNRLTSMTGDPNTLDAAAKNLYGYTPEAGGAGTAAAAPLPPGFKYVTP